MRFEGVGHVTHFYKYDHAIIVRIQYGWALEFPNPNVCSTIGYMVHLCNLYPMIIHNNDMPPGLFFKIYELNLSVKIWGYVYFLDYTHPQ